MELYVLMKVVYLVGVLPLLSIFLIRLIDDNLHAFTSTCLILTGLCYGVQLAHLVLDGQMSRNVMRPIINLKYCVSDWTFCAGILRNGLYTGS